MSKRHEELRDPENWSFTDEQTVPRSRAARAVVSVAFSRDEVERIQEYARDRGLKLSQFIREAALAQSERATNISRASFTSVGGRGQVIAYFEPAPASSAASSVELQEPSSAA